MNHDFSLSLVLNFHCDLIYDRFDCVELTFFVEDDEAFDPIADRATARLHNEQELRIISVVHTGLNESIWASER